MRDRGDLVVLDTSEAGTRKSVATSAVFWLMGWLNRGGTTDLARSSRGRARLYFNKQLSQPTVRSRDYFVQNCFEETYF
jgi:hypothetical protein